MKLKFYLAIPCLAYSLIPYAQQFENRDLEAAPTSDVSVLPASWLSVPVGDQACIALYDDFATPDLTSSTGPEQNFSGNAQSGLTFVTGMHFNPGFTYHEGIMQTVA